MRLIDQIDNVEDLRKRESFWQHELDAYLFLLWFYIIIIITIIINLFTTIMSP